MEESETQTNRPRVDRSDLSNSRSPRVVPAASFVLVATFGIWGLLRPEAMTSASVGLVDSVLENIGWLYLALANGFLVLSFWLAASRYGRLRLGPDDSRPEFSTSSWLAMLFAGGMGSGLVFWGVAEPVTHFAHPPGHIMEATPAAARQAMVLTNLHWGLHAWAIYGICALVLAYFMFRRDFPGLISTPLRATMRPSVALTIAGWTSDVVAAFAVVFGLAGSLVMGVLQVRAGISEMFGFAPTLSMSVGLLFALAVAFMISASTGLSKGIQTLSNLNMLLVLALLAIVFVLGPTPFIMSAFINSVGDYASSLPAYALRILSYENQIPWTTSWTLTYLIWWVAWGPFVGIFIARISRGRTIREFCVGVIVIPTLFSLLWFATLGGTGIWIELNSGGLSGLVDEDVSKALFEFLRFLPLTDILSAVSVFLIFIFLVTSADSGTFVISMMTSEGHLNPRMRLKLGWGAAITLLTLSILLSGSVEVAKAMAAFGAVPFTFVLVLQVVAFLRALRDEPVSRRGS